MKEGTIKNILDAVRDWVNNKEQSYKPGEIYESVPNEIIKMLWDGDVKFDELVHVTGAEGLEPVSSMENYLHFLRIFYTIDDLKQNAVTFTNNGESDFVFSFTFIKENEESELPKLFLITDDLEELEFHEDVQYNTKFDIDDITVAPGESAYIIGYNPKGVAGINNSSWFYEKTYSATDVTLSGNLMSLIDMVGYTKVIPEGSRFSYFFEEMYSLTDAGDFKLPATVLTDNCYEGMFNGCYNLINVPSLPATALTYYCYARMFEACTSITTLPKKYLQSTTLAKGCYLCMFSSCTQLVEVPDLPATTLAESCYYDMFSHTAVVNAPRLPATTLAEGCYHAMFGYCYNLEQAPELPAITLMPDCYSFMFRNCTSLTEAPILPAKTLVSNCYLRMFEGCTNLSQVTCLVKNAIAGDTYQWLRNVASEGTFTMNPQAVWSRGDSGIPTGWDVEFEEKDAPFIMVKSNDTTGDVELYCYSIGSNQELEYSTDRVNWSQLSGDDTIKIYRDYPLYLRGILTGPNNLDDGDYTKLQIRVASGNYNHTAELYGNVNSIWDYRDLNAPLKEECGITLFADSDAITKAPVLPSTTLFGGCYAFMFQGCFNLKKAPDLPATTLSTACYTGMFINCHRLNYIKCLAINGIDRGTDNWVHGVSNNGTFVKHPNATDWPTGSNGIPTNWDVENDDLGFSDLFD